MLIPLADDPKVEVPSAKLIPPVVPSERRVPGVVEPMPTLPPLVARYVEPVVVSWVVEAFWNVFNAPVNVCDARLSSATFEERAESAMDADGGVSVPEDSVNPFDAVKSPPNVPVDCVENAPVGVVVALPLTHSPPATES